MDKRNQQAKKPNILWIMCDQLRADYLSCYGHPHLHTPNIDSLAKEGLLFKNAIVQAPLCGPSRMSYYTGRYISSHGATMNGATLRIDEKMLGDYLREVGVRTVLVGKSEIRPNLEGLKEAGIPPDSEEGRLKASGGFEEYFRHEGIVAEVISGNDIPYNRELNKLGYQGDNPWLDYANGFEKDNGENGNGWFWECSQYKALIKEQHSETVITTDQAIRFMDDQKDKDESWCLHLSYIKPHWPYIAPDPYHDVYSDEDVLDPVRSEEELKEGHPFHRSLIENQIESRHYKIDYRRKSIIKAYMGLVKQIDDQVGRILSYLDDTGKRDNTIIIFGADHGDHLGDHWLGEKFLFFDSGTKVPLIISDPRPYANATRGSSSSKLVEAIDMIPTFLEMIEENPQQELLEGLSLVPLLRGEGQHVNWREFAVSELNFAFLEYRRIAKLSVEDCHCWMIRSQSWKYIRFATLPPQLFNLLEDPEELDDVASNPDNKGVLDQMEAYWIDWNAGKVLKPTLDYDFVEKAYNRENYLKMGLIIGYWDESELPSESGN